MTVDEFFALFGRGADEVQRLLAAGVKEYLASMTYLVERPNRRR